MSICDTPSFDTEENGKFSSKVLVIVSRVLKRGSFAYANLYIIRV